LLNPDQSFEYGLGSVFTGFLHPDPNPLVQIGLNFEREKIEKPPEKLLLSFFHDVKTKTILYNSLVLLKTRQKSKKFKITKKEFLDPYSF